MGLFKKRRSKYWYFDFTVRGRRYRGSTKETKEARANKVAGLKLAAAMEGTDPLDRKPPTLLVFSGQFLEWVRTARLDTDTQRYYQNGWKLLQATPMTGLRLDHITKDVAEALRFPGSASNGNNALRTLRRMLHKAKESKLIREVPRFRLFQEEGRVLRLDDEAECKLLPVAEQPLKDIIVLMRDTGMRNGRELYPLRIEYIDWDKRVIFIPDSKTRNGRRMIAMSDRVMEILKARCAGRTEGWVFPSKRKGKHISCGLVGKQWVAARKKAGLPEDLVLYCARHDFGTYVLNVTGNLKLVMDTMGHADVPTAMKYQHPELELVRRVINVRHTLRHTGANGSFNK